MSADQLLTAAQELATRDGLRVAVHAYMDAVDALVAERRIAQAQAVMLELLMAQEKKKGLFGRTDKNPLGSERVTVGLKFAQVSQLVEPSEAALDQLGYLALDFPDELTIRRANADALRKTGYAADAIDEYRYCAGATPDDAEIHERISVLYVGIGRPDDAAGYLMRAMNLYAKHSDFAQVAAHAEALIELRPASLGYLIDLLSPASGESLLGRTNMLDELAHRVTFAGILDAEQKDKAREQLLTLYQRLLNADRGNDEVAQGLEKLKAEFSQDAVAPEPAPVEQARALPKAEPAPEPAPVEQARALPAPEPAPAPAPAPAPEPAPEPTPAPMAESAATTAPAPTPAPVRQPPAATNALAAYTRRKARELFEAGDLQGALMCYERLLRSASDNESLQGVLDCYIGLGRSQEAARVAVELVNAKEDAGDLEGALATLDQIAAVAPDDSFTKRRRQLLIKLDRPEVVGR